DLAAIGAAGSTPRTLLPAAVRVPLPQLAVELARHYLAERRGTRAARRKVRRDEPAVGQANDGVQPDGIRCHSAANPGERRRLGPSVELEHLDRLARAVVDHEQGVNRAPSGPEIQTMRSEFVSLRQVEGTRTRRVGLLV